MLSKLWEWFRRNYGPVGVLFTIPASFIALAGLLLQNPGLIEPLVKVADSALPVGASFISDSAALILAALAGGLLAILRDMVDSRRKEESARRRFKSLHPSIEECKASLVTLPDMSDESTRTVERDALAFKAEAEVEVLADELRELGIPTLPVSIYPFRRQYLWVDFLSRLEVYARSGNLEAAVQLGKQMRSRIRSGF